MVENYVTQAKLLACDKEPAVTWLSERFSFSELLRSIPQKTGEPE
jgi:hypothetical protein